MNFPEPSPCIAGCPRGVGSGGRLIAGEDLVFSNNGETKFPEWVAYTVTPRLFGPARTRNWRADPRLPDNETLEPEDYVGAYAAIGVDRGHLAPLASFAGSRHWRATNYLSNIMPQRSALNRGPWARLEAAVRRLARQAGMAGVHVLTGPLYERDMPPLPNADEAHRIPSGYWKIVAIAGARGIEAAVGFAMDQSTGRSARYCAPANRIELDVLERRARIRFFPDLTQPAFATLMARSHALARRLGCEN